MCVEKFVRLAFADHVGEFVVLKHALRKREQDVVFLGDVIAEEAYAGLGVGGESAYAGRITGLASFEGSSERGDFLATLHVLGKQHGDRSDVRGQALAAQDWKQDTLLFPLMALVHEDVKEIDDLPRGALVQRVRPYGIGCDDLEAIEDIQDRSMLCAEHLEGMG